MPSLEKVRWSFMTYLAFVVGGVGLKGGVRTRPDTVENARSRFSPSELSSEGGEPFRKSTLGSRPSMEDIIRGPLFGGWAVHAFSGGKGRPFSAPFSGGETVTFRGAAFLYFSELFGRIAGFDVPPFVGRPVDVRAFCVGLEWEVAEPVARGFPRRRVATPPLLGDHDEAERDDLAKCSIEAVAANAELYEVFVSDYQTTVRKTGGAFEHHLDLKPSQQLERGPAQGIQGWRLIHFEREG
jgi:hypothetical protein